MKLSAPTVGISDRQNSQRPVSSASGSGRFTPSNSSTYGHSNGRITPSVQSGRITPSTPGHITPSATPAARTRLRANGLATDSSSNNAEHPTGETQFTTRASRYAGMTRQQLEQQYSPSLAESPSRSVDTGPSHAGLPSPSRAPTKTLSPTQQHSSPYATPKPGLVSRMPSTTPSKSSRPSLSLTPRPRIPSAVAMPPPSSPSRISRSLSQITSPRINGETVIANGKGLYDNINATVSTLSRSAVDSSIPSSQVSNISASANEYNADLERQIRVDLLESENHKLKELSELSKASERKTAALLVDVKAERDLAVGNTYSFEAQLKTLQRAVSDRETRIEVLERSLQDASREGERRQIDADNRYKDMQAQVEDSQTRLANLNHAMEVQQGLENKNDAIVKAKDKDIAILDSRIQKLVEEADIERKHLAEQIDELRHAGQVSSSLCDDPSMKLLNYRRSGNYRSLRRSTIRGRKTAISA